MHPDADFSKLPPGPSAPSFVQLGARFALGLRFLEWCARRYGDLFTLRMPGGEQVVFIADPQALKSVFTAPPGTFEIGTGGNAILEPLLGSGSLLLLDGQAHMRQRRLLLPPLHGERMQRYMDLMEDATTRSLEQWPLGTPFPLHRRMQDITFDVILRAVFGVEGTDRHEPLRAALRTVLDFGRSRAAFIPWVRHWAHGSWVRFIHEREQVDALLYDEIARRRREGAEGREDIFSMLLAARYEDGSPMTDKELRDELITLLVAGHETTATALAWTFELLFRHDAVARRLLAELRDGDEQYLEAVVTEALRVRPVIAQVSRKATAPFRLDGYEVPAGTLLAPSIYLVHRRADIYPHPAGFKPERFLDGGPETYSWLPFGGGVRRCVGASFATVEMKVVLRTVLTRAGLRPASHEPEPAVPRAITLAPKHGAMAVLERLEAHDHATAAQVVGAGSP